MDAPARCFSPIHAKLAAYRAIHSDPKAAMKTTSTPNAKANDWALRLASGQTIHVPGRISSMTTYVLLEQERWFEGEIGFVARLLQAGDDALDIGANHGVYTLALAGSVAERVWAFEPTREPRARLERTVAANGLQARVSVVPCALSDHAGTAVFHTSAQSELNSMHVHGGSVEETVALDTLDAFAARELAGRRVGFVKIDAEGEEPRVLRGGGDFLRTHEPIVMFEMIAGTRPQLGLLDDFAALGYGIFRHLPELDLLVQYQPSGDANDSWVLNLFAIKPAQQQRLARQGLLLRWSDLDARPADPAPHAEALSHLAGLSPMQGLQAPTPEVDGAEFCLALAHAASAKPGLAACAADRVHHLLAARNIVQAALDAGRVAHVAAWTLLVHCLHALGSRQAALAIASELLQLWPAAKVVQRSTFLPVLSADLQRARSTDAAAWMQQSLAEYVECQGRYSSFFGAAQGLGRLLEHPDHSAQIERRYLLSELKRERLPDTAALRLLPAASATANPQIWAAWIDHVRTSAQVLAA